MPLSTNPDDLIPFSLMLDEQAEKDPAKRPTFLLRFLSVRQLLSVQRLYADALAPDTTDEQANAKLNDILAIGLGGWRHLPIPFAADKPGDALDAADVLTPGEKAELAKAVGTKPRLTETDRKNSVSRSSSSTESCASTAPVTSAATSPQNTTGT
jgi:hypothetical protein